MTIAPLPTPDTRSGWVRFDALLGPLLLLTLVAVVGYATFGLHPGLLAGYPGLADFYGISFQFFGQAHSWAVALVLGVYLYRRVGVRWVPAALVVSVISLGAELLGTSTGLPFGAYEYTDLLGWKWGGLVPAVIPLSWFAMGLPGYVLARRRFPDSEQRWARLLTATGFLLVWDLALDPAMSHLTPYWTWGTAGAYYGMPWINLLGWAITGFVIMAAFEALRVYAWTGALEADWLRTYYGTVLLMPLGMVVSAGLWGAVVTTVAGLGVLLAVVGGGRFPNEGPSAEDGEHSSGKTVFGSDPSMEAAGISGEQDASESRSLHRFFRHHSRSFSYAAWWFSPEQRDLLSALYAFCRTTDDIVDGGATLIPGEEPGRPSDDPTEDRLDAWVARARRAYQGGVVDPPWLANLMRTSAEAGMPLSVVEELVEGVRMDLGSVRIESLSELDLYAHRVASVVGIWMCYLYGRSERELLRRAAAMGRAMQLSNIVRDVGEDLDRDRVYLPAELMERYGVTEEDLWAMKNGAPITSAYEALIEELMHRADAAYAYGFRGLPELPGGFRRASAVAAEVYRGIHEAVRENGFDNLSQRAYTRGWEKTWYAGRGLVRLMRCRWKQARSPLESESAPATASWLHSLSRTALFVVLTVGTVLATGSVSPAVAASSSTDRMPTGTIRTDTTALDALRSLYVRAPESEDAMRKGLERARSVAEPRPAVRAYEAAFVVLHAKHAFWPHAKLRYLRRGLPQLDSLVTRHPDEVEIRYLRLLSCYFIPDFLGMSESVDTDFRVLADELPHARAEFSDSLYQDMLQFVLRRGDLPGHLEENLEPLLTESTAP